MLQFSFQTIFKAEPEGGYTVSVPSLPGCVSYGETLDEAKLMIEDAIKGYIESMKKHNEKIPLCEVTFISSIQVSISEEKKKQYA